VIAVVDSAIDTAHSLLEGVVLPGWDFIEERAATASLRSNSANQSTLAKLDQSTMAILDRRTGAVLRGGDDVETVAIDPSTTALVAAGVGATLGEIGPAFGHGTMVAGIAHLAAPGAQILPLRAFDSTGYGDTFDVIQAIHYAAARGASVINLSFSLDGESDELERAIEYAVGRGSICVAAAGNDGASVLVYPAAMPEAIGVASTDLDDFVASFSNYGNDLVNLAAPGVAVITTYPGGGWAAASGTSFSTPWVSGAIALLAERAARRDVALDLDRVLDALANSAAVNGVLALDVGFGRVDFARAGQNLSLEDAPPGNGNN
jgi:subtilisin family serine protease